MILTYFKFKFSIIIIHLLFHDRIKKVVISLRNANFKKSTRFACENCRANNKYKDHINLKVVRSKVLIQIDNMTKALIDKKI